MEKSANQSLVDYFKKNFNKGYSEDSLKFSLIRQQGYSRALVEKALEQAKKEIAMESPRRLVSEEKPEITITEEVEEQPKKGFFKRLFGLD
ncbi:hypothetical protein J4474_02200 [Candidatus Pacearchaeota archaeon]|nr:hypothetical protein [Candidatus Pacearchaeota archaeon]